MQLQSVSGEDARRISAVFGLVLPARIGSAIVLDIAMQRSPWAALPHQDQALKCRDAHNFVSAARARRADLVVKEVVDLALDVQLEDSGAGGAFIVLRRSRSGTSARMSGRLPSSFSASTARAFKR